MKRVHKVFVYRLLGKRALEDAVWQLVAEGETDKYRFFKVSVAIP